MLITPFRSGIRDLRPLSKRPIIAYAFGDPGNTGTKSLTFRRVPDVSQGGVRFPVKGPLLDSWDAAVTFCQSVPKLAERIIKVSFGQSGGADGFTKYLVMTGLCGYVNHFEGVLSAPNAKLVALPENGLGDHLRHRCAG